MKNSLRDHTITSTTEKPLTQAQARLLVTLSLEPVQGSKIPERLHKSIEALEKMGLVQWGHDYIEPINARSTQASTDKDPTWRTTQEGQALARWWRQNRGVLAYRLSWDGQLSLVKGRQIR